MFHPDFRGVDSDGSPYTADAYFVRRAAETFFFEVDSESHPGGGVVVGYVLAGSALQRFSHVWLRTPQGWRLVAAQAAPVFPPPPNSSPGASRASAADEKTFITAPTTWSSAETAIVEALRALVRAEHAIDVKAWAALTDDHFWSLGPRGQKGSKVVRTNEIGRQTAATPLPTFPDVEIRIYNDLAIMRGVQEPIRPPTLRFTRVWVRHGGVWQQALNHQTFMIESSGK